MTIAATAPLVPPAPSQRHGAAFYDLDGTLCARHLVHAYGFYARHQPTVLGTLSKVGMLLASVPLFLAADLYSRQLFNHLFYRHFRGEREDRLKLFAQAMFEETVRPKMFAQAYAMIEQSRRAGYQQILVTGAVDLIAEPVARHLGLDAFVANQLEYVDGRATGRIKAPLLAGATKAAWIRRYAREHQLDLENCFAFADAMSDYPMLAMVGKPVVINPDYRLRRVARSFDWPILRFK